MSQEHPRALIVKNDRIGISEHDIRNSQDSEQLYSWQCELRRDVDIINSKYDKAKSKNDKMRFKSAARLQGYLLQICSDRLSLIQSKAPEI